MAAAYIATPTFWNFLHEAPQVCMISKATQSDWVCLKDYKGVIPLMGMVKAATSGANTSENTWTYGTVTFAAGATITATSVAATSATIPRGNTSSAFYVLCPTGEIIEVTNDSAPTAATSTFTIRRACLGTTAVAISAGDVGAIMNILFVGTAGVGKEILAFLPLPNESTAKLFPAATTSV
jgi:hypothetical protein